MVPARVRAHTIRVSVMLIAVSHFCNWQMTRRLTHPNGRAMTTTTQHITYVCHLCHGPSDTFYLWIFRLFVHSLFLCRCANAMMFIDITEDHMTHFWCIDIFGTSPCVCVGSFTLTIFLSVSCSEHWFTVAYVRPKRYFCTINLRSNGMSSYACINKLIKKEQQNKKVGISSEWIPINWHFAWQSW